MGNGGGEALSFTATHYNQHAVSQVGSVCWANWTWASIDNVIGRLGRGREKLLWRTSKGPGYDGEQSLNWIKISFKFAFKWAHCTQSKCLPLRLLVLPCSVTFSRTKGCPDAVAGTQTQNPQPETVAIIQTWTSRTWATLKRFFIVFIYPARHC